MVGKALGHVQEEQLPVSMAYYEKLVIIWVRFGSYTFNSEEYCQHEGSAKESPLSAVMTSLFMKVLGSEHYSLLIMKAAKWFRYSVD